MLVDKIPTGSNPPDDFNVIIEIPMGGNSVKYEMDKDSGALYVDRFLSTSMVYPANYGFIPNTLADDGDPCDVLVVGSVPVIPGAVIRVRPIGVLIMTDEAGSDDKILAVPISKINPFYDKIRSYKDLPEVLCEQIAHFFEHYKDLEKGKWVSGTTWADYDKACEIILQGIQNYNNELNGSC